MFREFVLVREAGREKWKEGKEERRKGNVHEERKREKE